MIAETPATLTVDQVIAVSHRRGLAAAWWLGWQSVVTAMGILHEPVTRSQLRGALMK
jgi:hypothetical protein